ncbi:MAG: hypothetical protein A3H35_07320 [Betaproteobacteria bacterium RIFCSPLOWO2_02_FULL_62_17]|nr:MAG: hypothetical protein A3H35_07320 [Betaproteobacteria bacterium RIFCSPLOWO2_02_FULL_62_17]
MLVRKPKAGKTLLIDTQLSIRAVASAPKLGSLAAKMKNRLYRHAFLSANITHGLSHQIRTIREQRGLTQKTFAKRLNTSQTIVSRLEDPSYGKFTLSTLLRVSKAFDTALLVKFVSFPKFLAETSDKSPNGLYAPSYRESEAAILGVSHSQWNEVPWYGLNIYSDAVRMQRIEPSITGIWTPMEIDVTPAKVMLETVPISTANKLPLLIDRNQIHENQR